METFVNDTPRITVDAGIDITVYSTLQIRYQKPDGSKGCWYATQDPDDDQKMYYDTDNNDLDQAGDWLVQGIAIGTGKRLTGKWCGFTVEAPMLQTCAPTTAGPTTAPPTTAAPTTLAGTTTVPTT